ncbi:MAG: transglycosylase domain-containing protein [Phototrophicales bacterium]|nr:transglycosylase domain-containing protein [Phototrophicales bacterium]
MSDNPPTNTSPKGGWQLPQSSNVWRPVESSQSESEGWKSAQPVEVNALPPQLDDTPQDTGDWHLPSPEDTPYKKDDVILIEPVSPEDELANLLASSSDITEVIPTPAPQPILAPEDLMALLEQTTTSEDDDSDGIGMSELVALASLAESTATPPNKATLTSELSLVPTNKLSPAERLFGEQHPTEGNSTEILTSEVMDEDSNDPAIIARQQIEALLAGDNDANLNVDSAQYATQQINQLEKTGASAPLTQSPTDYARGQLAQLGIVSEDATPIPTGTQPLNFIDPRDEVLAKKFIESQNKVRLLRQQRDMGQITWDDFEAQLRETMVLDYDQIWWVMDGDVDVWYKAQGSNWIEAIPDALTAYNRVKKSDSGRLTQVVEDSLPYLDTANTRMGNTEYSNPQDIPLDEYNMPLPRQVEQIDPQATVAGASAFNMGTQPHAATTIPSPTNLDVTQPSSVYTQPTVMAQPVNYGTIEAPYDEEDLGDDYDLDDDPESIYEEAKTNQRRRMVLVGTLAGTGFLGLVFLGGAGLVAAALLWYQGLTDTWKDPIASLATVQETTFQTVSVLDNEGNRIATLSRDGDQKVRVTIDQVSPYFIHAILSLYEPDFYTTGAWGTGEIIGAFTQNTTSGTISQNVDNITRLVARTLVITPNGGLPENSADETSVAAEMARTYTKEQILEIYINDLLFFGNQTYGIEAAAQFYFNKRASELNFPEAALLASITQSPATIEPVNNRQSAVDEMSLLMDAMAQVGCLDFTHTPSFGNSRFCVDVPLVQSPQVAVDKSTVLVKIFESRQASASRYPHFIELVREQLETTFGANEIYRGGYTVTTTLDRSLQDMAQQALVTQVNNLRTNNVDTGSVIVIDPRNGAILVLIGSPDVRNAEINGQVDGTRVYQQAGDILKPLVYATALNGYDVNGSGTIEANEFYTPASILWDVPTEIGGYRPTNIGNVTNGAYALRRSVQNALTIPAVKTYQIFGETAFRNTSEAMGIRFRGDQTFGVDTGAGAIDVRLIDMAVAYGTIANGGMRMRPYAIDSIVDSNGNAIPIPGREEPVQALRQEVAFLMQNILSDDASRAPVYPLNSQLNITGLPTLDVVSAMHGTSLTQSDLWTVGFTHNRVVGVWLGTFDDEPILNNVVGFNGAAPLWNQILRASLEDNPAARFNPPTNVVNSQVCADTGSRNLTNCANIRNEYFAGSLLPPDQTLVQRLTVDSWSGLIANDFCPTHRIEATFANISDESAINWINNTSQGNAYAQRVGLILPIAPPPTISCDANTPIPVGAITSPAGGVSIQGMVAILGQVNAPDFGRYQVEFAPAGSESYQIIGSPVTNSQPNANSTLTQWDTRGVPNGSYNLRLTVFANNAYNGFFTYTTPVTVNNPAPTPIPPPTATPFIPVAPPIEFTPLPFDNLPTPTLAPP